MNGLRDNVRRLSPLKYQTQSQPQQCSISQSYSQPQMMVQIIGRRSDPEIEFISQQFTLWINDPRRSRTGETFADCVSMSIESLHSTHYEYVLKDLKRRKNEMLPRDIFIRDAPYPFDQQNAIILQLTKITHSKLLQQFNFSKAYVYVFFDIQIKMGSIPQKNKTQLMNNNANNTNSNSAIQKISKFRLIIQLYAKTMPKTTFNFYQICQGNFKNSNGQQLTYKNTAFHKLQKNAFFQGGITDPSLDTSVFGKYFQDESFMTKHDQPGVIGMANAGSPHTNSQQFYITLSKQPEKDKHFVAFGLVIHGMKYLRKINKLSDANASEPIHELRIQDCGEYVFQKSDFVSETKKDFDLLDNHDILNTHLANYQGKKLMEAKTEQVKEQSYQQRQIQRSLTRISNISSPIGCNSNKISPQKMIRLSDIKYLNDGQQQEQQQQRQCYFPLISQEIRLTHETEMQSQELFEFTDYESLTYKAIEIAAEKNKRKRLKYGLKKQLIKRQQTISDELENRIVEEYEQEDDPQDFGEAIQNSTIRKSNNNSSIRCKTNNDSTCNNVKSKASKKPNPSGVGTGSVSVSPGHNKVNLTTKEKTPNLLTVNNNSNNNTKDKIIIQNHNNTPIASNGVSIVSNKDQLKQAQPNSKPKIRSQTDINEQGGNNDNEYDENSMLQQLMKQQDKTETDKGSNDKDIPSSILNFLSNDIKALFNPNVQLKTKKNNNINISDTQSIRDMSNIPSEEGIQLLTEDNTNTINNNSNTISNNQITQPMKHNPNSRSIPPRNTAVSSPNTSPQGRFSTIPNNSRVNPNNPVFFPASSNNNKNNQVSGKEWWRKDSSRLNRSNNTSRGNNNNSNNRIPQMSYFHRVTSIYGQGSSNNNSSMSANNTNNQFIKSNNILDVLNQQFIKAKENHIGFRRVISRVSTQEAASNSRDYKNNNNNNNKSLINRQNNNSKQSDNELMRRACQLGDIQNAELLDQVSQTIISKSKEEIGSLIVFSQIVEFKKFLANELFKKDQEDCYKELTAILPGLCESIMMQLPLSLKKSLSQSSEMLLLNRQLTQEHSIPRLDTKGTLTFMSKQAGFDISEVDEDW